MNAIQIPKIIFFVLGFCTKMEIRFSICLLAGWKNQPFVEFKSGEITHFNMIQLAHFYPHFSYIRGSVCKISISHLTPPHYSYVGFHWNSG